MESFNRDACGPVQSAFEIDGAGTRHDVTHAVSEDRVCEDGRGAGAVTDHVPGFLRRLTKDLGSEDSLQDP